jgi:hypothetical protein
VAITCAGAPLVGACTYGNAFDLDRTGILGTALFSTVSPVALVPLAVLFFLHSATDYLYPYHEDPYPTIAVVETVFLLGVASLGFLLRALLIGPSPRHGPRGSSRRARRATPPR